MEIDRALGWLEATPLAETIRENEILFPWIESIHVLAIVLVVGTIPIIDLRLLGIASLDRAATRLMGDVLPWTWGAFVIAAITGSLLFSTMLRTTPTIFFQGQDGLFGGGGHEHGGFHLFGLRDVTRWDIMRRTPAARRRAGRRRFSGSQWWHLAGGLASRCTELVVKLLDLIPTGECP